MKQSTLANLILNQYFTHFRCLIILTEHPAYFEYTGKQQIINLSIETSTNNSVFIQDFTTTNYHGCQGFVVDAFKPIEVFEFLEDKIRHSLERFKSRRYFFIINNAENNSDLEFNTEALTYVADVLIMFHKNEDEFEMWTHNYIGLKDMNSLKFLDTWYTKNKSFLYGNDLYPDKLTSQSGRTLTLTCLTYLPYVLCDENKTYDRYYGTEMRATVEYAIAHNMTIDFQYNEHEEELWGELYPNWTGTGVMGIIVVDKADIALASFQTWDFVNPYLDMSAPYLRSSICCLVPRPEDFSGWLIPLLSYSNWLWIAILVNFVFNVVTSALIDFYYEERSAFNLKIFSKSFIKSFWTLLRISMSQVLTKSPSHKYLPLRIVFLVLFLMYLILDSTYFSGLASTMTTPRTHPPINTVAELSLRNIKIYALSDAWKFSIQNADDEVYLVILRNFRTATVEQRELSKQKNNAFMIERLPYNAYAVNEYIQKDVIENYHLMEEDIFWDYSRFYLRKSSILSPSFDRFIMRLTEVGISDRWQTEAIFKFMDSTLQRMMLGLEKQKQTHRDILKLKIYHVKGAFGLLIIGYTIAGVTLLIEKWNSDIFTYQLLRKHNNHQRSITSEYHGCQGFLIDSLHPVEVFEQIEKQLRLSIVRFNFRRYLFIIRNNEKDIKIEFKTDALIHVADLLIVTPKDTDKFELWTHNFVGIENMNELKLLDIFFAENKSFLFETNLYPDKLKNLGGRIFKMTCFNYAPYASCDPNLPQDKLYGSELRAALEFIEQYNMTLKLVYNEIEEEYWGELFSNWTGTGLMGNILTDKADIGFSAFYTWGFVNAYLDISEPFIRTGITCLVPQPRMTSAWLTPLLSYSNFLWAAVLSNFLYNVCIFSLIAFYYEKSTHSSKAQSKIAFNVISNSFWAVLKISLSQGLTKTVNKGDLPVRIILVIFLLMYSILDSTYFSGLASIMTIPRFEPPINTVSDLAHENVNIFAISDAWIFSIEKAEDEDYVKILSNFHIASDEQRELSMQKNNAFFIERLPFNNYAINDYIEEDVIENYHLMEEDVYWEYTRFFLRKSSVFTQSFDEFLLRLMENGMASRWQLEAVYHFMDFKVQRITSLKDSKKIVARAVVKLNLFHVEGAFALLIIGYLISFIAFLIEKRFCFFHIRRER